MSFKTIELDLSPKKIIAISASSTKSKLAVLFSEFIHEETKFFCSIYQKPKNSLHFDLKNNMPLTIPVSAFPTSLCWGEIDTSTLAISWRDHIQIYSVLLTKLAFHLKLSFPNEVLQQIGFAPVFEGNLLCSITSEGVFRVHENKNTLDLKEWTLKWEEIVEKEGGEEEGGGRRKEGGGRKEEGGIGGGMREEGGGRSEEGGKFCFGFGGGMVGIGEGRRVRLYSFERLDLNFMGRVEVEEVIKGLAFRNDRTRKEEKIAVWGGQGAHLITFEINDSKVREVFQKKLAIKSVRQLGWDFFGQQLWAIDDENNIRVINSEEEGKDPNAIEIE